MSCGSEAPYHLLKPSEKLINAQRIFFWSFKRKKIRILQSSQTMIVTGVCIIALTAVAIE